MKKIRLLFVDDEDSIRLTLAGVFAEKGYEVAVAASVKEGLEKINSQPFDVLLADLNIGGPGDGFTLVGAMRETQPQAINIIITGYPDFESALDAIRRQVDEYVVKPTDIDTLVQSIEQKLSDKPQRRRSTLPVKSVAQIIEEGKEQIIARWLKIVSNDSDLSKINLTDAERIDHLPDILDTMVEMLRSTEGTTPGRIEAAKEHGEVRRRQGYEVPMIVEETRLLERSIFSVLQTNLLSAKFDSLIPGIIRISDTLQVQLKASLQAYLALSKRQ